MPVPQPVPRVDRATMTDVFGEHRLMTVTEDALAGITHAPTRAFLAEVGLPDQTDSQGWFHRARDLDDEVREKGYPEAAEKYPELAPGFHFDQWVSLGEIPYDALDLDATTGAVYASPAAGGAPYQLNSSLDVFAYLLCVVEAERPFYSATAEQTLADGTTRRQVEARLEHLYGTPHTQLGPTPEARLRTTLQQTDPIALTTPDSTWHMVLRHITQGLD